MIISKNVLPIIALIVIGSVPYIRGDKPLERRNVITNMSPPDGFGSQFQNIVAAAAYAELHGKQFLYTPFRAMEHNYDNDVQFLAKKEWLINFIGNFNLNPFKNLPITNYKEFFDQNVTACANTAVLQKIRTIFRANKNKDNYLDSKYFTIALHIRRPNPHDNRTLGTDTPDSFFLDVMQVLRQNLRDKSLKFHIYTQGDAASFTLFNSDDVMLHLNESIEDTFIGMALADLLLVSASSFSYAAGLLSEGIVYYIPFWHAPLPHWIPVKNLLPARVAHTYRSFLIDEVDSNNV